MQKLGHQSLQWFQLYLTYLPRLFCNQIYDKPYPY